jgi:Uma2 family endonuclease
MPVATQPVPVTYGGWGAFRQFSVAEYNQMIASGILDDEDKVELLEGQVVLKMPRDPKHDGTIQYIQSRLYRVLPAGWDIRTQLAVTMSVSQPEPDFALVRGTARDYLTHHPYPSEVGLVVEVANTSLQRDTLDKTRVYAADAIPEYWVVDVANRRVEVYSAPAGGAYTAHRTLAPGDALPLTLGGVPAGILAVADLLP